jgi:hypothetical protein
MRSFVCYLSLTLCLFSTAGRATPQIPQESESLNSLQNLLRHNPDFAQDLIRRMSADPEFTHSLTLNHYTKSWMLPEYSYGDDQGWIQTATGDRDFLRLMMHHLDKKHVDPSDILEGYRQHKKAFINYYFDQILLPDQGLSFVPKPPSESGDEGPPVSKVPLPPDADKLIFDYCDSTGLLTVITLLSNGPYVDSLIQHEKFENMNSRAIHWYRLRKIRELIAHYRVLAGMPPLKFDANFTTLCNTNNDLRAVIQELSNDAFVNLIATYETNSKLSVKRIHDFRLEKIRELIAKLLTLAGIAA